MSLRPFVKSNDNYLSKLIKYIPAEVQATYVFLAGLIASESKEAEQYWYFKLVFIILIIITPLWIFFAISTGTNAKASQNLRVYQSIVAVFALVIWAYNINMKWVVLFFSGNLPESPLFASILLALFTLFVPLVERIFVKPPPSPNPTQA